MADHKITVKLSQAIQVQGEETKELAFRDPTGGDFTDCGFPVIINADESFQVDAKAMNRMMARLSDAPPSSLATMKGSDWVKCVGALMPNFTERDRT